MAALSGISAAGTGRGAAALSMDTIFATASGPGRAGIAVIRICGAEAAAALTKIAGGPLPPPRQASLRKLRDPRSGEIIDHGIVLWFPGPGSFTGEDMAELQVHGGRAVLQALLGGLASCAGLRLAEPGEFTRRAFENGKLDLTAAEGLADLINAETEAQRRQAFRQMEGALGRLYEEWRQQLLAMLARIEAQIDFPEDDLPGDLVARIGSNILKIQEEIVGHLNDGRRGERLRDGLAIVLLGAPNVGKSSLINALAGRDLAIVSARAGTTRDVVELHLDLGGLPVLVADTAGLRASEDEIESEGVRRAMARAGHADLKILMFDATSLPEIDQTTAGLVDRDSLIVLNKIDQCRPVAELRIAGQPAFPVSAKTGEGMDGLVRAISSAVAERTTSGAEPLLTRERHRTALSDCLAALSRALTDEEVELLAEDLRIATRAIGRITGRVDVEDILDLIFREFCIGK
jgi:tRNA modification GTPase